MIGVIIMLGFGSIEELKTPITVTIKEVRKFSDLTPNTKLTINYICTYSDALILKMHIVAMTYNGDYICEAKEHIFRKTWNFKKIWNESKHYYVLATQEHPIQNIKNFFKKYLNA